MKLSLQDAKDLLVGCTILGTGGGGSLQQGIEIAETDYKNGLVYELEPLSEVKDDGLYTSPYYCGSIGEEDLSEDPYEKYEKITELETVLAVEMLERFLQKKVSGIVSVEYGGGNTAVALSTAARLGKVTVDADAAGRAVPDLQFSTFYIAERPIAPLAIATSIGEVGVIEKVADDFRAEALVRAMSVVSGNAVGMSDHPITGKDLKTSVIDGALTYAMKVGKAQREANEQGKDPINSIIQAAEGYVLFKGKVKGDTQWKNHKGFTLGSFEIDGIDGDKGSNFKVFFKNENVISWKDGKVFITCPDLICVVELDSGYPILNPNCKDGVNVAVLGFKAPKVWREGRGLSILNPSFFGFDEKWIPIEDIMK